MQKILADKIYNIMNFDVFSNIVYLIAIVSIVNGYMINVNDTKFKVTTN